MVPRPMRPAHNVLVIVAMFLVAGALLPWSSRLRLACAAGAVAIVLLLLVVRMRAHTSAMPGRSESETQARIDQIRSARERRMGRRRP
jgi:low affinity Fe/Cu permease